MDKSDYSTNANAEETPFTNQIFSVLPSQTGESSANSSAHIYTPQVRRDLIPKIGQRFDTIDAVHTFYNNYARDSGFGIRSNTRHKFNGEIVRQEYVCFKEGVRKSSALPPKRKRGLTREGCGAKLAVTKDQSNGGFVVRIFVEGHVHPLTTPRRVHLLYSHRDVTLAKKSLTQTLADANVSMSQQMSILELQSGGLENVGCLKRDIYNAQRDRRKLLDGHDATMLYEHFKNEQEKNPDFAFEFETDDEGRMIHCFWADATSRKSYLYFGDVVVFDTTYNTNKYSMIFAPLLGVNHHRQTTLFGCAFLSDETSDSFQWLFNTWLKAMEPAPPPKMIITDQDPAMTKAISICLPNTHHRYCIWHITSKFSEKISAISYKEHYGLFQDCIWKSETPEEFETKWVDVVKRTTLSNNEWLDGLYKIRDRWVPAYMNHMFSADMTSSQRAEICHAFFKKYVSPNNSLFEFVTRFKSALSKIRHNELHLDHLDMHEKPVLKTMWLMESQMSGLYTRCVFYKFQDQLFQNTAYVISKKYSDEHHHVYNVRRGTDNLSKGRELVVHKESLHVTCSYKMFDCSGIPCRHILKYFTREDIIELPETYILQRWTQLAKATRVRDVYGGVAKTCDTSLLMRRNKLFGLASNLIDEAICDKEASEYVEELLESGRQHVANMKVAKEDDGEEHIDTSVDFGIQNNLKEPLKVRAKGCGRRLKGGKEKSLKKKRRCNGCGLMGQSHDKRNCPKLQNKYFKHDNLHDEDGEDVNDYFEDDDDENESGSENVST